MPEHAIAGCSGSGSVVGVEAWCRSVPSGHGVNQWGMPAIPPGDAFWRGLIDAIPANLALIDPDGIILSVNQGWQAFAQTNDWNDPALGIGRDYVAVCRAAAEAGDESAVPMADGLAAVLAGRIPTFSLEYPCHGPDQRRWFTVLVAPLPMADGRRGAVVLHIDITQRRLAEERLAAQNDARYRFIFALAHEIRSPLQAIIGFSDLLGRFPPEGAADPRTTEYLGLIRQSGDHILEVVSRVLDLAKAEAGRFELSEEVLSLAEVADFATLTLRGLAETSGVLLRRCDSTNSVGLSVRGDRRLLRQALINLISNAIKVSPSGAAVDVAVEIGSDGRPGVRVTDHGPGIAAQDLERIMEPFVQIGPSTSANGSHAGHAQTMGTGLGLPLARMFARLHGGDVVLSSATGVGTSARILIPGYRRTASGAEAVA